MVLAAATLSAHADGDDWLHTDGRRIMDDWTTWDDAKWNMMKSSLWQTSNGTFIGLDHVVKLGSKNANIELFDNGTKVWGAYTGATTGIAHVQKSGHAFEVARYDVTGRKVSKGTPGMVIVKMSDGTYKKVFVKY